MSEPALVDVPVAHQFDDPEQQRQSAELGMWTFLATEVLFFGGLFTAYTLYRTTYPADFAAASRHLSLPWGTANTAILILSSLTMALAVYSAGIGSRKALVRFLLATVVLGSVFLGIKAMEYSHHFHEGLFPSSGFSFEGEAPKGARLFYTLYFSMTGVHALHMVIGIGLLLALAAIRPRNPSSIEMAGLYWHFVDVVWIFLFPLLYLLGRHG
ncbi:MAG: cytochrome c oxidase subunit 3 family protein [Vicinamibacteria bacterium]